MLAMKHKGKECKGKKYNPWSFGQCFLDCSHLMRKRLIGLFGLVALLVSHGDHRELESNKRMRAITWEEDNVGELERPKE